MQFQSLESSLIGTPRDRIKGRVLVKVISLNAETIPRKWVLKNSYVLGGMGESWIVSIFILNSKFPDALPRDEDLPQKVAKQTMNVSMNK